MRNIVFGAAAAGMFVLSGGLASAADLPQAPYKAPAVVAPMMYNWSGFYIGANGGYGWSSQCVDLTAINGIGNVFAEGCKSAGGGLLGGQIGYRWQAGQLVFGLEGQGDWANIRNTRVSLNPGLAADTWRSTLNGLGLFTGQLGYAVNEILLYGKGGAMDLSIKGLSPPELAFIIDQAHARHIRIKDFSRDSILQREVQAAVKAGLLFEAGTGLHFHIDRFANRRDRWTALSEPGSEDRSQLVERGSRRGSYGERGIEPFRNRAGDRAGG